MFLNHIKNSQKTTSIYIDGANLHRGILSQNWEIDYKRFFVWLSEKYKTRKIYLFLGYLKTQKRLYDFLKNCGYILIFKETLVLKNGATKGNCDAELVIQALEDFYESKTKIEQAILISGDGDFACLIDFWQQKKVFPKVFIPNRKYCSYLLKKKNISMIFLEDRSLRYKYEKTPIRD